MGTIKAAFVPLPAQGELLCRLMPGSRYHLRQDTLRWWGRITPSSTSESYQVRVTFRANQRPIVHVLDPPLLVPKDTKLPHMYVGEELCLYFPDGKEWHPGKVLAYTMLPWIAEWLFHYEIWVVTGQWNGGGTH